MPGTPAGPKVTGAVGIWCGLGPSGAPAGLGYGREAPRYKTDVGWHPFYTDLGGPAIPLDEVFASVEVMISVALNWFREDTMALVEARAGVNGFPLNAVGSLAIFEGLTYPLTLVFPKSLNPIYKAAGLPPGIRFLAAKVQSIQYSQGTVPQEATVIWKAKAVLQGNGAMLVADRNLAGIPPYIS